MLRAIPARPRSGWQYGLLRADAPLSEEERELLAEGYIGGVAYATHR